ncbi:4413_t:CDS:2 [Funneliformis geosporum]|nr:4413_t:CDS:2 [Funneliformis geosporum]
MQPEINLSEQERVLLIKKAKLKAKNAELEIKNLKYVRLKTKIADLEAKNIKFKAKNVKLETENAELLKSLIEEYTKKLETKKNCKFQTKCIQIAKKILNEKPIIKYHSSFLNGLELNAFFQKYQITVKMQDAQHWLYSTS